MIKKLSVPFLIAIIGLLVAVPVLAAYYIDIDVTESNGTDYNMLPILEPMPIDYLVDNQFITEDGLDVRVKDGQGNNVPFMLTEDRIAFASAITGDMVNSFQMTTGNTPLDSFAVCVGDGGYITISDHANLELGDDFKVEFEGWVDTDGGDLYPSVASTATSVRDTYGTSHTVTLPSGIVSGDLLVVLFSGYVSPGAPSVSFPGGWTAIVSESETYICTGAAYRVADGSEGSTITVTTSLGCCSSHQSFRITDYQGVPESSTTTSSVSNNSPNPPSLSPSWGINSPTLWIAWFGGGIKTATPYTLSSYPTYYSDGLYTVSAGDPISIGNAYTGSARRELASMSENPGVFTLSGSINWLASTIAVRGENDCFIVKDGALAIYSSGDSGGSVTAIIDSNGLEVTAPNLPTGEYEVTVWADGSDFGIDIDGSTEDSTALGGASVPDNSNDWVISVPCFDSYTHTTSDTLRITYAPDSIIVGTTLPNELSPGTYDGVITWGSNPAGIDVDHSGLQLEETYYATDPETASPDIFEPEMVEMTTDVNLERLEHNPLNPLVEAIAEASGGQLTERLIWLGGAWIIFIVCLIFVFFKTKENITFTCLVGVGLSVLFYVMGIFNYGVIILFGIGAIASIVHERMPTL